MTATPVVPSVVPPSGSVSRDRATGPVRSARPPLPLARLAPSASAGTVVYCLTALDDSGRIRDRSLLNALGWAPGTRVQVRERGGLIAVIADPHGVFRVTGQGYVLLPAAARHWCGLATGDRVLVVADPTAGWLVVHPPAALESMLAAAHASVWGGELS